MIIELFGLPASGKSTIARKLGQISDIEVVKIKSRVELLWYIFLFFIRNPIRFLVLLNFTLVNLRPWKLAYYKFMNLFLQHNAKYAKAKRFKVGVIDQGHMQNFLSLFERELSDRQITLYYKILPKSDFLIVVEVSEKERQERLARRGYGIRRSMDDKYFHNWESVIRKNFNKLCKFFANNNKILFINSEESIENNIKIILEKINL